MNPEEVQAILERLDGSSISAVSLLTNMPAEKLKEYGGMPEEAEDA